MVWSRRSFTGSLIAWKRAACSISRRQPRTLARIRATSCSGILLENNPEAVLVTGEGVLLRSDHFPGRILSPRDFVARYLDGA